MTEQTHPGVCAVYVDLLREAGAVLAVIDGDEDGDDAMAALRARMSDAVDAWDRDALNAARPSNKPALIVSQIIDLVAAAVAKPVQAMKEVAK